MKNPPKHNPATFAYLGLNDSPAKHFDFWGVWFGALANPQRLDDEGCPEEHWCFGYWVWLKCLQFRYGAENVEQVTPVYLLARDVYRRSARAPMPGDSCAYVRDGRIVCSGSCERQMT